MSKVKTGFYILLALSCLLLSILCLSKANDINGDPSSPLMLTLVFGSLILLIIGLIFLTLGAYKLDKPLKVQTPEEDDTDYE